MISREKRAKEVEIMKASSKSCWNSSRKMVRRQKKKYNDRAPRKAKKNKLLLACKQVIYIKTTYSLFIAL